MNGGVLRMLKYSELEETNIIYLILHGLRYPFDLLMSSQLNGECVCVRCERVHILHKAIDIGI